MNFLNWFLNFLIICYIILINLPYFINTYTWCLQVEANRCIYDEEAAPQSQHHPTNRQVWHPDTKGAVPPQEQGSDRALCHPFRFNNKLIVPENFLSIYHLSIFCYDSAFCHYFLWSHFYIWKLKMQKTNQNGYCML